MSVLQFLNTKAKAFVIFLMSMAALGLFALSTWITVWLFPKWYALIAGIVLMVAAIPCYCLGKRHPTGYLLSFLINSIASGLSAAAHYTSANISLHLYELLAGAVPAAGILLLVYLMLQIFCKTKKVTVTVATIINMILTIALMVLWIMYGYPLFSFGFFASLISIFYLCVFGISVNHDERSVLRDVSFGSFGSFIILTVVVIFILSEGEILDGLDLDLGGGKKGKAKGK